MIHTPINFRGTRAFRFVLFLLVLALVAASCGGDEGSGQASTPSEGASRPAATEESAAATEESAAATEESAAATEEGESAATEESAAATEESAAATEESAAATEESAAAPDDAAAAENEAPVPVELDKVVATHHFNSFLAMPAQFGRDKGFFEKNGIDLELISVPAGQTSIATLIAGDADVAHQGTTSFMALIANQDQPMRVLGSLYETLGNALLMRPGLELPNKGKYPEVMHDLVGFDVGVSSLGGQQQLTFDVLLQNAGLPSDAVNYVSAGYTASTTLPALQRGDVDVAVAIEPVIAVATSGAAGETFDIALDLRKGEGPEQFVGWIQNCYGALEHKLDERPDVYRRFDQTIREVKAYISDTRHRDEVVEWMMEAMTLDEQVALALYDNNMFGFASEGFTEEAIAKISDTHVMTGLLDRAVTYTELVWWGLESAG